MNRDVTVEHNIIFMKMALAEAAKALQHDDVPVGAVIVRNNEVLARAKNERELQQDATAHAELLAIRLASQKLHTWHLEDCSLYVTLEPCAMCAGAIINARIARVFFAAYQPKSGALVSCCRLFDLKWNHQPSYVGGILEAESSTLLQDFFKQKRQEKTRSSGLRRKIAIELWRKNFSNEKT